MKGYSGFRSWDETYLHHKHNTEGRTVLAYRQDESGREPWTWVRLEGKGRVFYTAWGHDERTWGHPGFANLLERGIRWATQLDPSHAGPYDDPARLPLPVMKPQARGLKPFEYDQAKIAFYPPGGSRKGDGTWNQMQRPVSPDESQKHLVVPEGFVAKLFAAEPEISKPLCMNWDERGRLWIAETKDYPNELQPAGEGRDQIKICEDTDGDGKADTFTVFADKLSIPTSLTFSRGGVIVHQAPQTLFLKDLDGDDKADERRVLFEGWSTRDTHAGPSNMRYGLDNWIIGMVGYSGFAGAVGPDRHRFSQGFYRFKPDGSRLEFLRSTSNNSWGVGLSEEGLIFGSTANRNPSMYLNIPNRYYERVNGWSSKALGMIADTHLFHAITDRVRQVDHHGGYTAAAGHALYTARTYPRFYWNRTAFVAEPTGHLVGTFVLEQVGTDFRSSNPVNLVASDDEWTAPTMAEVGPDGQVWIIDWYNYIVQHNPTPTGFETGPGGAYVTDLRDKTHGRIYRIVHEGGKAEPTESLAGASPEKLVATLRHTNMFWRIHAQRLLVEQGNREVVPALLNLIQDEKVDELGLNPGAIHALWTLHGLGLLDGSAANATKAAFDALGHPSAGVRMNAVQVLPQTLESTRAILAKGLIDDREPLVRLRAILALADLPRAEETAGLLIKSLQSPSNVADQGIKDALTVAAATHSTEFLQAIAHVPNLTPALSETTRQVAEHFARVGPIDRLNDVIGRLGTANAQVAENILEGLAKGWRSGREVKLDPASEAALGAVLRKVGPGSKGVVIRLARDWGSKAFESAATEVANALLKDVRNPERSDADRVQSARQLVSFQPSASNVIESMSGDLSPQTSPALAVGILEAIGESESPRVGPSLVELSGRLTPEAKKAAIRILLRRPTATSALLDGIEGGKIPLSDLTLDQSHGLSAHPDQGIARRARALLARGGGLPNADRQKVIEELSPLVLRKGNPARGKTLFQQQCAKCHTHGSEGGKVGPDLTGMAVHPKEELLVHILDPSRSVEGNFRQYTVATTNGQVLIGILTSESRTSIELADAEGKTHAVQRAEIEELQASNKSIMPEGFEKQLAPQELCDLLEFLTQRGKYLPLDLAKSATIVSTLGMFYSKEARGERLDFKDWSVKTFEGIPFRLVDPQGSQIPNVILLNGPQGSIPPKMPRSVSLACQGPAKTVHLLSGVSGWGFPGGRKGSVSLIVRLHYQTGEVEDHPLRNGIHFADYIRRVDVPESKFAFGLDGRQVRYLAVHPRRAAPLDRIELVKGSDTTAPLVVAVTVEELE